MESSINMVRILLLLSLVMLLSGCQSDQETDLANGTDSATIDENTDTDTAAQENILCPRGYIPDVSGSGCAPLEAEEMLSEEVAFWNGKQELFGTITKPSIEVSYRFPAVILIHGSGPRDRDVSTSGSLFFKYPQEIKVFRDIAEYLSRFGYLVLRYDKRTCMDWNNDYCEAKTYQDRDKISLDIFKEDANAGFDYLKTRDDVNAEDLIVIGHSQGGPIAIEIGVERDDVKSVVSLAGPATSLKELILDQVESIIELLKEVGADEGDISARENEYNEIDEALTAIESGTYPDSVYDGSPVEFWESWIASHERIKQNIESLKQPIAVVSGTEDYNVPPKHTEQLETWRGQKGGDFFKTYDGLTHALIKYYPETNTVDFNVSEELLNDLKNWLATQEP